MSKQSSIDVYVEHRKDSEGRKPNDERWIFINPFVFALALILGFAFSPIGLIATFLYYHNNKLNKAWIIGIVSVLGFVFNLIVFIVYILPQW